MDFRLFAKPEYVRALRLLTRWDESVGSSRQMMSLSKPTEKCFTVIATHYCENDPYYQTIYVWPGKEAIYFLSLVSGNQEYNNNKVVPEVIRNFIEEEKAKNKNLMILQLTKDIDRVNFVEMEEGKEEHTGFGFWAVKRISMKDIGSKKKIGSFLDDFAYPADRIENGFEENYHRF